MPALEINELVKRYRNGTLANDGLSLDVEEGEIYGLLGPNGAGKTTLVRQVLGLLRPTSGSVRLDGVDLVQRPGYGRERIGFLPQGQFQMDDVRVEEMIVGIARLRGLSATDARVASERLIERLDLGAFRKTSMRAASGGVKRLAAFAASAVARPRLLVLDEPTNDVDPVRRQLFWEALGDMGRDGATVLLVTHNLAEAERVLHRLAIIDNGRILRQGTAASLRAMVTDRLRLEVTGLTARPHIALTPEPTQPNAFLFDQADLVAISGWLASLSRAGEVIDFRIGPPTLDDIYTATVARPGAQPALATAS